MHLCTVYVAALFGMMSMSCVVCRQYFHSLYLGEKDKLQEKSYQQLGAVPPSVDGCVCYEAVNQSY